MKNQLYVLALFLSAAETQAQPFNAYEQIDINNFNQRVLVHGDMWWDPLTHDPKAEFPAGTGKHALSGASLCMGAHDQQGQLKVAVQTYRQFGLDYWPGPLDQNGTLSLATSADWARIWKINKTTIDSFKAISIHTVLNTPLSILEWPALQNPYATGANGASLTITTPMAPFIDKDGDGKYDPLKGDYPDIKGDQMLWWVFSDNGPTHDLTKTEPLRVEIHAAAYAYKRNTLIDNVVYYEYAITNKSNLDYLDFRVGLWTDSDLGYGLDDYIGFDSTRRLGYLYNGKSTDGIGAPEHYGSNIPASGIVVIKSPNDQPGYTAPLGSFMPAPVSTSPTTHPTAVHYNNSMRSIWQNGTQLKHPYTSTDANYGYPDDPLKVGGWSECMLNNGPFNRRFMIATDDYEFKKGSTISFIIAAVVTPAVNQGCPIFTPATIKEVADTAINLFGDPLSVPSTFTKAKSLKIYPNPANDKLSIEAGNMHNPTVTVYSSMGSKVFSTDAKNSNKLDIAISHLPSGVYHIVCQQGGQTSHGQFVKQ